MGIHTKRVCEEKLCLVRTGLGLHVGGLSLLGLLLLL